ncbi:MAG: hypothetical protein IPO42_10705 [Chitinophagaceae bacterium]|nr:hypothetical protein [Chitinophagaceae bacterium]
MRIPQQLAEKYPDKVTILDPYVFYYPLYNKPGLEAMFEKLTPFPRPTYIIFGSIFHGMTI